MAERTAVLHALLLCLLIVVYQNIQWESAETKAPKSQTVVSLHDMEMLEVNYGEQTTTVNNRTMASCILGKCCGAQSFQPLRFSLHCSGLYIQSSQYTTVVTYMRVLCDVFKFPSVVNCGGPMLL